MMTTIPADLMTYAELAAAFGMNPNTIRYHARRLKLTKYKSKRFNTVRYSAAEFRQKWDAWTAITVEYPDDGPVVETES